MCDARNWTDWGGSCYGSSSQWPIGRQTGRLLPSEVRCFIYLDKEDLNTTRIYVHANLQEVHSPANGRTDFAKKEG